MNIHHDYPLPVYKQEASEKYFNVETEWMAAEGYAESKEAILRKVAMHVILLHSKSDKFDPFIPYLAMNFFDRFISRHQLPTVLGRVRDDIVLAANSCLTLAWKMRDHSFSLSEFLLRLQYETLDWKMGDHSFSFSEFLEKSYLDEDYKEHITKMELHILRGLKWKVRAVSPVCFVRFLAKKIPIGKGIKRRTLNEIIIQTQGDISFTRFKPSVIAASALLAVSRLLYNDLYDMNKKIILAGKYVEEDDLEACLEETYELCIKKNILLLRDVGFEDKPKLEIGVAEIAQAGETSNSSSHRPGKDPMQEQNQDEPEGEIDQEMNFELKWMMWSSENPEDWAIKSPDFRTPAPVPDDPNDGRVEARNYFNLSLCAPCRSCIIL